MSAGNTWLSTSDVVNVPSSPSIVHPTNTFPSFVGISTEFVNVLSFSVTSVSVSVPLSNSPPFASNVIVYGVTVTTDVSLVAVSPFLSSVTITTYVVSPSVAVLGSYVTPVAPAISVKLPSAPFVYHWYVKSLASAPLDTPVAVNVTSSSCCTVAASVSGAIPPGFVTAWLTVGTIGSYSYS